MEVDTNRALESLGGNNEKTKEGKENENALFVVSKEELFDLGKKIHEARDYAAEHSNVDSDYVDRGIFRHSEEKYNYIFKQSGLSGGLALDMNKEKIAEINENLAITLQEIQAFQLIVREYTGEYYDGNILDILYELERWLISETEAGKYTGNSLFDSLPSAEEELVYTDVEDIVKGYEQTVKIIGDNTRRAMYELKATGVIKDDWIKSTIGYIQGLTKHNYSVINKHQTLNK